MGLLYKSSKLLNIILDSLEDQEGGAMYISCDVSNGGPVEPETGYVPNNPLFGLSLDSPQQECAASCVGCLSCQGVGNTTLPISALTSNDFDCGACFDTPAGGLLLGSAQNNSQVNLSSSNCIGNTSGGNTGYWSTDEMASTFPGLPPLDIDPLPSLFPFSPCGASYNFATNPHQASLSYTVHPHQMLISPSNTPNNSNANNQNLSHDNTQISHYMNEANSSLSNNAQSCYYDPMHTTSSMTAQHLGVSVGGSSAVPSPNVPPPPPPMYPSMSVNVSMNMTMHGYGATEAAMPMQCSQMQWSPPSSASSVNVLYPPVLGSSHYPAATYSITADFRGPSGSHQNNGNNVNNGALTAPQDILDKEVPSPSVTPRTFYANTQLSQSYTPPDKSPNYTQMADTKSFGSGDYDDEDSNDEGSESKPNLCRLCGKTYARPSTLKTHLRTHSGERPYRCPDCNKSFSQAANLTAHVRTHTGQKPFRCPICDRRFSQSSSVTTHMRTHSGERPYRCSSCKKSFSDSSTLTKHLRIHSGEKPYQCKLCLLRFSQSGNLNRHMRVHGSNNNNNNNNNNNGTVGGNNLIT